MAVRCLLPPWLQDSLFLIPARASLAARAVLRGLLGKIPLYAGRAVAFCPLPRQLEPMQPQGKLERIETETRGADDVGGGAVTVSGCRY